MANEREIDHLLQTHSEVRGEITQRIAQRDTFAIQFIVSIGAVFSLGFLDFSFSPLLFLLLPPLTIFYSIQILYSYTIHDRCHKFLVEEIEPRLAELLEYSGHDKRRYMWETYSAVKSKEIATKAPGIRKNFFIYTSYVMPFIASGLFGFVGAYKKLLPTAWMIGVAVAVFIMLELLNINIFSRFNNRLCKVQLEKLGRVDFIDKALLNSERRRRAVFLDRDGTLHIDKVNTHKVCDLELFPDTVSALKALSDAGFLLIIVSNQDGIRSGLYDTHAMHEFNAALLKRLSEEGIRIGAVYYSPYEALDGHYSFKPNPGMLIRAKSELNIAMEDSYFIGDQMTDAVAAHRARVKPVIVRTGIYKKPIEQSADFAQIKPALFGNLTECCEYIISDGE